MADDRGALHGSIKALSNQKYHDLVAIHGVDRVGLLTGDNSINADAPVVVMTTEVLRNMIYGGPVRWIAWRSSSWTRSTSSRTRTAVRCGRRSSSTSRPTSASSVCPPRSPTPTRSPTDHDRPWPHDRRHRGQAAVRLDNLYMVGDRTSDRMHLLPTLVDGRPNHVAARLDDEGMRGRPRGSRNRHGQQRRKALHAGADRRRGASRPGGHAPGDLLHLQPQRLRRGGAVRARRRDPPDDGDERERIREIVDAAWVTWSPRTSRCCATASSSRSSRPASPRTTRHGAPVQGDGRGVLRRGSREGRLRHRDAGRRDQHCRHVRW